MPFTVGYSAGGVLDRIKAIDQLPYPFFPTKRKPLIKGFILEVPAVQGVFTVEYTPSSDAELIGVSVAASGYAVPDFWELEVGQDKLFETIYTKELPEWIVLGPFLVFPVLAGTTIRFSFHNDSRTSKQVWLNLSLLRD